MNKSKAASNRVVRLFPDADALALAAAQEFQRAAAEAIESTGRFMVALSGGRTPLAMYARLAAGSRSDFAIDWSRVSCFWGDERMVPPADSRSNFGEAWRAFLGHLPHKAAHCTRVRGELPVAEEAAAEYEREILGQFELDSGSLPRFDLVLLGLGVDGHTASLFPDSPAVSERKRIAVAVHRDPPDVDRVTLTLPVINNAARVIFLVSGADKADALAHVLEDDGGRPSSLPAGCVSPVDGDLIWLVDAATTGSGPHT